MKFALPSLARAGGRSRKTSNSGASGIRISGVFARSESRDAWWPLDETLRLKTGQPLTEAPSSGGVYISFAPKEDHCLFADKNQRSMARDMTSDVGEPLFVQRMQAGDLSSDDSSLWRRIKGPWLYGTAQSRMVSLPDGITLISGQAAIRAVLSSTAALSEIEAPFVTGVLFPGHADVQVLVLMQCTEDGDLKDIDYIPLAGLDPAEAVRSFVQTVRLSSSGEWTQERTAIFSADDLAEINVKAYPRESQFLGLSASTLWKQAAIASAVACVCTGVAGGGLMFLNDETKTATKRSSDETKRVQASFVEMLSGPKLGSVLERRSVDVKGAVKKAGEVWLDGSLVTINATPEQVTLSVAHKIQSPEQSPEMIVKALGVLPPEGCTRQMPATTLQITELYLTYECKTPDADLQRLGTAAR